MIPSSILDGAGDQGSMPVSTSVGAIQCSTTLEVASTIPFGVVARLVPLGVGVWEDLSWQQDQSSSFQEANMATVALFTAQDLAEDPPSRMVRVG